MSSRFIVQQKEALLHVARLYSPAVYEIANRDGREDISIRSSEEGKVLDDFADKVYALVARHQVRRAICIHLGAQRHVVVRQFPGSAVFGNTDMHALTGHAMEHIQSQFFPSPPNAHLVRGKTLGSGTGPLECHADKAGLRIVAKHRGYPHGRLLLRSRQVRYFEVGNRSPLGAQAALGGGGRRVGKAEVAQSTPRYAATEVELCGCTCMACVYHANRWDGLRAAGCRRTRIAVRLHRWPRCAERCRQEQHTPGSTSTSIAAHAFAEISDHRRTNAADRTPA